MSNYGVDVVTRADCEALLREQRVGRVSVCGTRPGVFPVLYALLDGDIVFRTAPGEKLIAAALRREVVFEIDSYDLVARTGWSVNVLGTAVEIEDPDDLTRAHELGLEPWAGEIRDRYVRIAAREMTGRRVAQAV